MVLNARVWSAWLAVSLLTGSTLATASESVSHAAQSMPSQWSGPYPWNYEGTREREVLPNLIAGACAAPTPTPRVLLAGDSWAQFMWDDNTHNQIFDKFGQADKRAVSRSRGSNPGPGYSGPEYAISGSEAREWFNTASYPWIANVVAELQAIPSIDQVVLSLGGNDILAGRSGGGWYKDMDLDVPGSEAALFARIQTHSTAITQAFTALRPNLDVLVSSYEYPNFNVSALWCWIYACPKRDDLSRDPVGARVTDQELNAMSLEVEARRIAWTNANSRLLFDHGVGEMHHYYGDGIAAPGILPRPGQSAPAYLPFPAGQPNRPSLRSNFRTNGGISADPIHLNPDGYLYKVAVQAETHFFPRFRGPVSLTLASLGGAFDGWTDGVALGTDRIIIGDDGVRLTYGIVSFDTSVIPPNSQIEAASLYLLQDTRSGTNPLVTGNLGLPRLDVAASFGAPQVELGDATAPADASNVGCFVGSANAKYFALRIDLVPAALAAIRRDGLTQFRLAFSTVDPSTNRIVFTDGDALLPAGAELRSTVEHVQERQADGSVVVRAVFGTALQHRGIGELLGHAKPILDIRLVTPMFSDGFEQGTVTR